SGDRFGVAGPALRNFTEDKSYRDHRARRFSRPGHRNGHRTGRIFHETVRRRKIHRRGARCAASSLSFLILPSTSGVRRVGFWSYSLPYFGRANLRGVCPLSHAAGYCGRAISNSLDRYVSFTGSRSRTVSIKQARTKKETKPMNIISLIIEII